MNTKTDTANTILLKTQDERAKRVTRAYADHVMSHCDITYRRVITHRDGTETVVKIGYDKRTGVRFLTREKFCI